MNDVICPYCFTKLTETIIERKCNLCGDILHYSISENVQLRLGKIPHCKVEQCNGQYSKLSCPKCHKSLPSDITQYNKYLRFALVGPSSCGKTVFLTTMLTELKQCRNIRFNISAMDSETKRYYENNYDTLYGYNKNQTDKSGNTKQGNMILGNTEGVHPMQWSIQDSGKMKKKSRRIPCYSLTIFDGAGETQATIDTVTNEKLKAYISGSKMIMLLIDPLKLHGVVDALGEEKARRYGAQSRISREYTADFINGIIRYLKESMGKEVTQKIETPIAVVLGKLDLLEEIMPAGMTVLQPSGHALRGAYYPDETERVHNEINSWLSQYGDGLSGIFDSNFTKWKYFGVSSFGRKPKDGEAVSEICPLRVLDPLMWNFHLEHIAKEAKE